MVKKNSSNIQEHTMKNKSICHSSPLPRDISLSLYSLLDADY